MKRFVLASVLILVLLGSSQAADLTGVVMVGCKVGLALGPELAANGSFEVAGTGGADVFADWAETTGGSSTINRDTSDKYSGSASCRMDIDADDGVATISQVVTLELDKRYRLALWHKAPVGEVPRLLFTDFPAGDHELQADGTWVGSSINLNGTGGWAYFYVDFSPISPHTQYTMQYNRFNNENQSIRVDDISIKEIL